MGKKKIVGEDGKQYVVKEKKPFYKRVWFWILAVVVLFIAIGALSGEDGKAKKVNSDTPTKTSESKSEEQKTFNVGDTVDIDGYQIKVNDVRYSDSEGFSTPDEGKQFVIINLTITNKTDKKVSFNPLDFSLNENGVSSTTGFTYVDGVDVLSSGDLDPDASVTGNLVGQAAPDSKLKIRYEGNMFLKNKEVDINLR